MLAVGIGVGRSESKMTSTYDGGELPILFDSD